jgi:ankyrin repeat protein
MPSIEDLKQVFSREQPSFDTWSHSRSNNGNERYTEGGRGGRGGGGKTNPFDDSSQDESKVAGGGGGGGGVNPFADSFSMASSSVVPAGRNPFANESESKQADVHHAVVSPSGLPPRPFNNPRHSWDSDREFPVMEITRIKKKTKKLRESRGGSGTSQNTNSIFRDERDFGSGNEAAFMAVQTSATGTTGGGSNTGQSVRKHKSGTWSADASLNRRSVEPPDSLDEVMDRTENSTTDGESAGLPRGKEQRSATRDSTSPAAKKAQQNLMQGFHRRGKHRSRDTLDEAVEAAVPPSERLNTSDPSTEATHMSGESANKNLTLHDLCGEATTTDDVAWRNALYLLSVQPHLATISDEGWTPLHICCLGASAPPSFMVRAMLYCNRGAARQVDEGDRLPLHLVAASSGDVETMQLLVEEYPQGIYQLDVHGQTPLHLLLRNVATELTSEKARVLLGLTLPETADFEQQKRVLQRRGEHLDLKLNELGRMMSRTRPVSILERERLHESEFETYPQDVQISLKKLEQWKKRQRKQTSEDEEAVEVVGYADGETNPAAIPTVAATQLPIHMLVRRAIVDRVPVESSSSVRGTEPFDEDEEDDDDCKDDDRESSDVEVSSEAPRASVPNPIAVLRLFAAAYPEGLVLRDAQGFTPLLAALLAKDIIPSVEVIEILLGKRSAGYESPPIWAQDMSLHRIAEAKYMNPAMVPMADSNQLPLHVASEEMLSNFFLIESIHESYPGAIQIQDSAGKTPLHLALSNYRRIPADPRVVSLLLSDRVAQIRDDDGKLPFDLLVESGKSLPSQLPRHWSFAEIAHEGSTATDVSSVYQRLFTVSILGEARPNNSAEAKSFLRRLGSLPVWLRRQACQANFVQELLIEELSSPLNCSFVILDGMLLVLLITVFRIQMKQFVDSIDSGDVLQSWYTYTVYAAAATRIAFQALFWVLSVSLAEFQQAVLLNGWGWIDCSAMMITLFTSVVLYGSRDIDQLLTLGTVSTGLLWLTLIGYLARWWYGMAILTGALSKVSEPNMLFERIIA